MFFRITPRRVLLVVLIAALLSAAAVVAALTLRSGRTLGPGELSSDPRAEGILPDGRITGSFRFIDPRLSSAFSAVVITLQSENRQTVRASYRWGGGPAQATVIRAGSLLPETDYPDTAFTGSLELLLQPSGAHGSVRLESLTVVNSLPLAVPSANSLITCAGSLFLMILFAAACSYEPAEKAFALRPALLAYAAGAAALLAAPTPDWSYLLSFFLLLALLFAGYGMRHLLQVKASFVPPQERGASYTTRTAYVIAAAAAAAGAAALRILGIGFGLPEFYLPADEAVSTAASALLRGGELPEIAAGQPPLMLGLAWISGLIAKALFGDVGASPAAVSYVLRCMMALFGAASVLIVSAIGRILYSTEAGLLAALLLAVAPLHVAYSRYAETSVLFVFFFLCAVHRLLLALKEKRTQSFLLGACFTGLALGTSAQALILLPALVLPPLAAFAAARPAQFSRDGSALRAYLLSWEPLAHIIPMLRRTPHAAAVFLLSTLAALPLLSSDAGAFAAEAERSLFAWLELLKRLFSPGSDLMMFHFRGTIWDALSMPVAVLTLAGCGWLLARNYLADRLLLILLLLSYISAELSLSRRGLHPEQSFLLCVPLFALALGAAGAGLHAWFMSLPSSRWVVPKRRTAEVIEAQPSSWRTRFLAAAAGLMLAQAAVFDVGLGLSITNDTRRQAGSWLTANAQARARVIVDSLHSGPTLARGKYRISLAAHEKLTLQGLLLGQADFLALSSFPADSAEDRSESLLRSLEPAARFSRPGYSFGYHHPQITIFDLAAARRSQQRAY